MKRDTRTEGERSNLVALIRAKRAQMAKLRTELDEALRELRQELEESPAPQPAVALTVRPAPQRRDQRPALKIKRRGGKVLVRGPEVLPEASAAYYAAQAIQKEGHPLHVRDMLKWMEQEGNPTKQTTLVGSLSRWVGRRVFYRAGPNVFGLAAMRKA